MSRRSFPRFFKSLAGFQSAKVEPWIAFRSTVGLGAPLAIAAATGYLRAGLAMSTGALTVAFRDSSAPYAQRARLLVAASVLAGGSALVGGTCGHTGVLAVPVAGMAAFAAGMAVCLGPAIAELATMSLVLLLIYSATPQSLAQPVTAALFAFSGGIIQTLLALAGWPVHPRAPERRALADLYDALAAATAKSPETLKTAPASPEIIAAQSALTAVDLHSSLEGVRYLALLSQAERMRLALVSMSHLKQPTAGHGVPDRLRELCAEILGGVARMIRSGSRGESPGSSFSELNQLVEDVRALHGDADGCFQIESFVGQLRAASELADHATDAGSQAFAQAEAAKPTGLQLGNSLATLRANLGLQSAAFRHALRLAVCVAIGDTLARLTGVQRSYWLPMTVAIVLKPDFGATFSRGVLRLLGTVTGIALSTVLLVVVPATLPARIAVVWVCMFVLRCFGPAHYGIFVTVVTSLVVFLLALAGVEPVAVIGLRAGNTLVGGGIALLAYALWPTWERSQYSAVFARTLEAYRDYFHAVHTSFDSLSSPAPLSGEPAWSRAVTEKRLFARLSRTNLEASGTRLLAEPGPAASVIQILPRIQATVIRLAHALMTLESGLYSGRSAPPGAAFQRFASDVETTLGQLASALRGSPAALDHLPDLREDHHTLVHSSNEETSRLVLAEADRLTNCVNTLAGHVRHWVAQPVA